MNKRLFEFQIRVHLTREHPKYCDYAFGILIIWLYCTAAKTALENGVKIARFFPFKLGGAKSFPITEDMQLQPYQVNCIEKAKTIGGNIAFFHWPKGTDEKLALAHWPLLVPPLNA